MEANGRGTLLSIMISQASRAQGTGPESPQTHVRSQLLGPAGQKKGMTRDG